MTGDGDLMAAAPGTNTHSPTLVVGTWLGDHQERQPSQIYIYIWRVIEFSSQFQFKGYVFGALCTALYHQARSVVMYGFIDKTHRGKLFINYTRILA